MPDFTVHADEVKVVPNENLRLSYPPLPSNDKQNWDNPSFVTGSRAYGNHRPDSDIDLVVLMDREQAEWLDQFNERDDAVAGYGEGPIKIGKLELIICTTVYEYNIWKTGTENLMQRAPVSRDEAIKHFAELRETFRPEDFGIYGEEN